MNPDVTTSPCAPTESQPRFSVVGPSRGLESASHPAPSRARWIRAAACCTCLLLGTLGAFAESRALPSPPDGFRWQRLAEVKAALLVPDGWHFKSETHPNTFAYFASKEDIDRDGLFLTGLTVNVMPHLEDRDAPAYANYFISQYSKGRTLIESWDASMGPFIGSGCRVRDDQTIMHTLMIANPKTNTLYLFIFEAPAADWQDAWTRYGETMVRFLLLDDEV